MRHALRDVDRPADFVMILMSGLTKIRMTDVQRQAALNLKSLIKSSRGKLYVGLGGLLRARIDNGDWAPGEQIPPLEKLANEYEVALVTVRQAVGLLEEDGLLYRRQGKGTFVMEKARKKDKFFIKLEADWQSLISAAKGARVKVLKAADSIGKLALEPDDGKAVAAYRYMRRVHISRDIRYVLVDMYLDRSIFRKAPRHFETDLVMPILEAMPEVRLHSARQTLTIGTADVEAAALLEVPVNSPVGIVKRVLKDEDENAIYVAFATYRGDVVRLDRHIAKTRSRGAAKHG